MESKEKTHPFLRTLGPGPYRIGGTFDLGQAIGALQSGNVSGHNNMMANAPRVKAGMGTCAHCGHAILFICIVKVGNGDLYGVGSDCIIKTGMPEKEVTELRKALKARQKVQRKVLKAKKGSESRISLESLIKDNYGTMESKPHPKGRTS